MTSRKMMSPVGHAGGKKMAQSLVCVHNLIVISTIWFEVRNAYKELWYCLLSTGHCYWYPKYIFT